MPRKLTEAELVHWSKKLDCPMDELLFHTSGGWVYNIPSQFKGVPLSQEQKDKISKANKGRKRTPEQRKYMSERKTASWTDERRKDRGKMAVKLGLKPPVHTGTHWWNNGVKNARSATKPGPKWQSGRVIKA